MMIVLAKPYTKYNMLAFFNEAMVSLFLYFMIGLTDFNLNNDLDIDISHGIVFVLGLTLAVNLIKAIIEIIEKNERSMAKEESSKEGKRSNT